jgi:hypothetical protein
LALLVAEHAAQMQGVDMLRLGGKSGAIKRVRLDEAPLLVQGQRLLDATRRIRARGGVLGHIFKSAWLQAETFIGIDPGKVGQDG